MHPTATHAEDGSTASSQRLGDRAGADPARDSRAVIRAPRQNTTPLGILAAILLMLGVVAATSLAFGGPAGAATTKAVNQCNGVYNADAQLVRCDVSVTNNLNLATGVATSVVDVTSCHGAPGTPGTCTSKSTPSSSLAVSVTQCNGSGNKGGSTVRCTVHVLNNITGVAESSPATINQCNQAGTGGGTAPTTQCNPNGSTTNADIVQCNQSGNGGGGVRRVRCTVTTSTSTVALPVTINQCVGSGNGGGATVICTAEIRNRILAASTGPSATGTTAPTTGTGSSAPPVTTGAGTPPTLTSAVIIRPSSSTSSTHSNSTDSSSASSSSSKKNKSSSRAASRSRASVRAESASRARASSSSSSARAASSTTVTTSLAATGADSHGVVALAALLLGAGALMLGLGRRPARVGKHR